MSRRCRSGAGKDGAQSDDHRAYANNRYRLIIAANEHKNPLQDEGTSYQSLMKEKDVKVKHLTRPAVQGSRGY